ncbi:MAG TPA: energy transducer TonB [Bacteroidales bacterium]|nr:energy transducer TonB [Bacteroidales bacterium]
MELKKNPKVDLQNKKLLFFEIGLAISLGIVLLAFEWTTTDTVNVELAQTTDVKVEQEIIPITNRDEVKPPEPPKQITVSDVIKVVEDNVNIDDNTDIFDSEFFEDKAVAVMAFKEEEEEEEEYTPFVIVEDMPAFQGGDINNFRVWVQQNLKYPDVAAENGIQGRVIINFVVEPSGKVSNVKVVRGVDPSLDKEAVRVVSMSPKWKPGSQRGKAVRVQFTIPIIFVLQ